MTRIDAPRVAAKASFPGRACFAQVGVDGREPARPDPRIVVWVERRDDLDRGVGPAWVEVPELDIEMNVDSAPDALETTPPGRVQDALVVAIEHGRALAVRFGGNPLCGSGGGQARTWCKPRVVDIILFVLDPENENVSTTNTKRS
jgi:hypothetical protein